MADPEHIKIVLSGIEKLKEWRSANPKDVLDLNCADLQNLDLSGLDGFAYIDFKGADLRNSNLTNAKFSKCNFSDANISNSILKNSNFFNCEMTKVNLTKSDLSFATFQGGNLNYGVFEKVNFFEGKLYNNIEALGLYFKNTNANNSLFSGKFHQSNFCNCDFSKAYFQGTDFKDSNFCKCTFHKTKLDGPSFEDCKGLTSSFGLQTIILANKDANYIETIKIPPLDRIFSWENLRTIGKLPLFGISYSLLISIPIFYFCIAFYNDKISIIHEWASLEMLNQSSIFKNIALIVTNNLKIQTLPNNSLVLLISTIFLAIASTFYAFFCPSRIKEFSKEKWRDQLRQSLLFYLPLSWKHRSIRIITSLCYFLGGTGVLFVLSKKIFNVMIFIVENT